MKKLSIALIFCLLSLCISTVVAQEKFRHRGVELYQQGKYAEAVSVLNSAVRQKEFKADAEIWNYLGLSLLESNELKKGQKALEQAVKLKPAYSVFRTNLAYAYLLNQQFGKSRAETDSAINLDPKNITAYQLRGMSHLSQLKYDLAEQDAATMIEIDRTYAPGYSLHSDVLVARISHRDKEGSFIFDKVDLLKQALAILKTGIQNCSGRPGIDSLIRKLEKAQIFYDHYSAIKLPPVGTIPEPPLAVTPFKVLFKPKALYTDAARQAHIEGIIQVAILFGADGRIQHYLLLSRLGFGLDEEVERAVKQIKFTPKMVDGKPVSLVITYEYIFNIY